MNGFLQRNGLKDSIRLLTLLVVSLVGTHIMDQFLSNLPGYESWYHGVPLLNFASGLNGRRILFIAFLAVGCYLLDRYRGIGIRELPAEARALLIAAIGLQTYSLGLLEYNHYYDSWMVADRLLLAALGILAIVRPLFIPLFLVDLVFVTGQLRQPGLIGYDHVHKFIFPHILALVWCYLATSRVLKIRAPYILLIPLIVAPLSLWYIVAGIGKLEMDWPAQNSLYNLFAAATDAGWLEGWSRGTKLIMADLLETYRLPLLWGTIVVEILLPPLLFTNRPFAIGISLTLMAFHLSIYLFSGILFWQWSVLELVFIYFLLFRKDAVERLFTWRSRAVYWLILLFLPAAVHIGKLAWYDCGYINQYRFFLVDEDGRETELDATYFSPYDTGFAKNRFYFLTQQKTLANTYGQCTDVRLLDVLGGWEERSQRENLEAIEDFRRDYGMDRYNKSQASTFRKFLITFIENKNLYDPGWISLLSVPPHMQQGSDQRDLQVDDLKGLKIVYHEKVILPQLEYLTVVRDSLYFPLPPQTE